MNPCAVQGRGVLRTAVQCVAGRGQSCGAVVSSGQQSVDITVTVQSLFPAHLTCHLLVHLHCLLCGRIEQRTGGSKHSQELHTFRPEVWELKRTRQAP